MRDGIIVVGFILCLAGLIYSCTQEPSIGLVYTGIGYLCITLALAVVRAMKMKPPPPIDETEGA
jgi:hypothetical protein